MRKLSDIVSGNTTVVRSAQAPVPVPEAKAEPAPAAVSAGTPELHLHLAAPLLLAAAPFASSDEAKKLLQHISIQRRDDGIWIYSTNGHIAFRGHLPLPPADPKEAASAQWGEMAKSELRLSAKALKKHSARAISARLRGDELLLINSREETIDIRPNALVPEEQWLGTYPNIDQLWPDSFTYQTDGPIAVNASYLKDIAQAFERIDAAFDGTNVCKIRFNRATTPITFSAGWADGITAELLLMPVQIRAGGDRPAIDVPRRAAAAEA